MDGGLLINNRKSIELNLPSNNHKLIHKPELNTFCKSILSSLLPSQLKIFFKKEKEFTPPMFSDKSGYPRSESRDKVLFEFSYDYLRPISNFSRIQLKKIDKMNFDAFKSDSRFYYMLIANNLKGIEGLRILNPEIDEEIVPFCAMLLIEKKRDFIVQKLLNEGFSLMAWPNFSKYSLDNLDTFNEVEIIGKKIVQININSVLMRKLDHHNYFKTLINRLSSIIVEYK